MPSSTATPSAAPLLGKPSRWYGSRLGAAALLSQALGCDPLFADVIACEDIPYNTGDRFLVTVTEILPVDPSYKPCVPLAVGDSFEVTVAEEVPDPRQCVRPATGEPIPAFLAPFVDTCQPFRPLGLACDGQATAIDYAIYTDARANETSPGSLWVSWRAGADGCIQEYSVTLESLPPL